MPREALVAAVTLALLVPALAGCLAAQESLAPAAADAMPAPFSTTDVFPGAYDTEEPATLEKGPFGVLSQETHLVASELDGAAIQVFVVRPDVPDGVRVPVVADAGPYFPPMHGRALPEDHWIVEGLVAHGYAFALVSVRGTGDSGGCMDLMGPAERHDVDQAVTWLGTQEWSNGNVGMFGGSYDGSTQWEAASTGNPHLKTIVPIAGIPDLFEHQVWNGTAMAWTPLQFSAFYWIFYGALEYNPLNGRDASRMPEQTLCPESAKATAVSVHSTLSGERDPTGFWAARDWKDEILENYRGSVYMIHGFKDFTVEPHNAYPFVNELEARGVVVKHTLGPWGHEAPWRADWLEILKRWYDRWLKGNETVDLGPKVQVMDDLGGWRSETAWPPTDATPLALHLGADGRLSDEPGPAGTALVAPMVPVHDPVEYSQRFNGFWKLYDDPAAEACPACPRFETEPLAEELRVAGLPRLQLAALPTGPGGHVTAVLWREMPDGERARVGFATLDLRFGAGDGEAREVVPGHPVDLRMEFEALDAVFPAGSKLALVLHQGGHNLRLPAVPTWPVEVRLGEDAVLTLPAIERGPEDLHEAPPRIGPDAPPR